MRFDEWKLALFCDCLNYYRLRASVAFNKQPDKPFLNFRASRSGDRRILCSSGKSCDGIRSSKIVTGSVGRPL